MQITTKVNLRFFSLAVYKIITFSDKISNFSFKFTRYEYRNTLFCFFSIFILFSRYLLIWYVMRYCFVMLTRIQNVMIISEFTSFGGYYKNKKAFGFILFWNYLGIMFNYLTISVLIMIIDEDQVPKLHIYCQKVQFSLILKWGNNIRIRLCL